MIRMKSGFFFRSEQIRKFVNNQKIYRLKKLYIFSNSVTENNNILCSFLFRHKFERLEFIEENIQM